MQRLLITWTCLTLAGLFLQSRDIPKKGNTFTVYINFEDYSVRANVLYDAAKVKAKMGHMYYWYGNNDIKITDGSFDGKLLHGEYKSFYRNMNLKEQGNFNNGLKDGVWKSWYDDGKIHELTNYKKGKEQGVHDSYDEQGNITCKTNFKNGIKNGKMISYQKGKIDTIIKYKNGEVQTPKPAKPNTKNKTQNDSAKSKLKKTVGAKDTVANTRKSSFSIKNIFNKKGKADAEGERKKDKPAADKKAKPKSKKKPVAPATKNP